MKTHTVNMLEFNEGIPFGGDGTRSGNFFRNSVKPLLDADKELTLEIDMNGIESMTDSFCHAFFVPIWDEIAQGRKVKFKGCNPLVKDFIMFSKVLSDGDRKSVVDQSQGKGIQG